MLPQQRGQPVWCGVVAPSSDRVGRVFPLLLAEAYDESTLDAVGLKPLQTRALCLADWLDRIGARLADASESPAGRVIACSALRRAYRALIRSTVPGLRFVFLDGPPELIRQRMARREGHDMPTGLLASQLQTLERPGDDEPDVLAIDIAAPVDTIVVNAVAA